MVGYSGQNVLKTGPHFEMTKLWCTCECARYQDRYPAPPTHIFLLFHNKLRREKIIQMLK